MASSGSVLSSQSATPRYLLRLTKIKIEEEAKHSALKRKFAELLTHEKKRNPKASNVSIKTTIIGMFDVVYDAFLAEQERDKLIASLDLFLGELNRACLLDARAAFIYYFHKLLRKRETLPVGFLPWFEAYTIAWQEKKLFGKNFNFDRWRKVPATDFLRTHRNFNSYPKKRWHFHTGLFRGLHRDSSEENFAPILQDTDESDSQFAIANIFNDPILLLYFLIESNILYFNERQYMRLLKICRKGDGDQQVRAMEALLDEAIVLSKPNIRILQNNNDDHVATNKLTLVILEKLKGEGVQCDVLFSSQHAAVFSPKEKVSIHLHDATDNIKTIVYSNAAPKAVRKGCHYIYASSDAPELSKPIQTRATNFFSPMPDRSYDGLKPYVVHRIINTEKHHFELLKIASIRLVEEYLVSTHVAVDRLKNAMCLLRRISALPVNPESFAKLNSLLTVAKKLAMAKDERVNAQRFSFFRRNRFGSRYMELLDDLQQRVAFCLPQEERAQLKNEQIDMRSGDYFVRKLNMLSESKQSTPRLGSLGA